LGIHSVHIIDHSSGGSSGGEGAHIALRGNPLRVGTDIGGYAATLSHALMAASSPTFPHTDQFASP
jgi:Amidase